MRISETHTITFNLTEADERLVRPLAAYHTYRGRRGPEVEVVVNYVKVDVIDATVRGEGAVVLKNGSTSGYGHFAELTEEDQLHFAELAGDYLRSTPAERDAQDAAAVEAIKAKHSEGSS